MWNVCRLLRVAFIYSLFCPARAPVPVRAALPLRSTRNAFTPGVPRPVEPRYPLVDDAVLARELAEQFALRTSRSSAASCSGDWP